jgi:hypothetical protein
MLRRGYELEYVDPLKHVTNSEPVFQMACRHVSAAPILFCFHSDSESGDPKYLFMRKEHSLEDAP